MRDNLRTRLQESNLIMQRKSYIKAKDQKYEIGDLVYIKRYVLSGQNYKLSPQFDGPYKIMRKLSKHKYLVKHLLHGTEKRYHVDRIKPFSSDENVELRKQQFLEESESESDDESEDETSSEERESDKQTDVTDRQMHRQSNRLRNQPRMNYDENQCTYFESY